MLARHGGQPAPGLGADDMLHRHGFARTQQTAVEDRVRTHAAVVGVMLRTGRGMLEAPGLDALLPIGEHKRQIGLALMRAFFQHLAGGDKQAIGDQAALIT